MTGAVLLALRLIGTAALYIFILSIFYFQWVDLKVRAKSLLDTKIPAIKLTAQYRSENALSRQFLDPEIIIGRNPDCNFPIEDDSASGQHARIAYHHKQWWLEDFSPKNGTKLNGHLLTTPTVIISGDVIQCGRTEISVSIAE